MLKPAVRRALLTLGALALAMAVIVGLLVAGLSMGPVEAGPLEPVVERVLAGQVEGGRAQVDRVQVVRYRDDGALGLRMHGVNVVDGQNRPVLRARLVEAGLGTDAILLFAPAPSRLVVKDFFVAASVSPQGRYALGYDAKGPPPPLDLELIFLSLTGEARRDRPLSYLRHLDLENGVVRFRQVDGPVAWTANVQKVDFEKANDRFDADSRLTVNDGQRVARVTGHANGDVGLESLVTGGSIDGLVPARIFPAVGLTRPLSILEAPLHGRANLRYALDRGITAADVNGGAGEGLIHVGGFAQRFDGAELVTRYDPATRNVLLERFDLRAERTHLGVTGRLWLAPERQGQPARVHYRFESPHSLIALNPAVEPQTLTDLTLVGSITPKQRRLEVSDLQVRLAGAPVRMKLAVHRPQPRVSPGIQADIVTSGPMSIHALYALWPADMAPAARKVVMPRLHAATVLSSTVHADIPPGQLDKGRLENRHLRVAFRYAGGGVKVAPQLAGIEDAVGQGVVQGNRFDLTMATGRIGKFAISDATVTVPRFLPQGATATVKSRATGDLGDMLRLIDSPPLNMMGASAMTPDRFSGPADLVLTIKAPVKKTVRREDVQVTYEGRLNGLRIKDVTLGEDLKNGQMTTRGDLNYVEAAGPAQVGPFKGKIAFRMPLKGADAGRKFIKLDGKVALLGAAGAPFQADINTRYGIGRALVNSRLFDGRADWRKGERMMASGVSEPAALRQAGLPAGPGLPERMPVRLAMTAKGSTWTGELEADAYSGDLTYIRGPERTVRYVAEITPAEARRIGVGALPMFARTQPLRLDARLGDEQGFAQYRAGTLDGRLEWGHGALRFETALDNTDMAGLGIPLKLSEPLVLDAQARMQGGGLVGEASVAGLEVDYQASPAQAGSRTLTFSGTASERTFARLGLDVSRMLDGPIDFSGRLTREEAGVRGRLSGDFDRAALRIPNSGWAKAAGAPAEGFIDLTMDSRQITLNRIFATGEGLAVRGRGAIRRSRASVTLHEAQLDGFFDGSLTASRSEEGLQADVEGAYLDFRPILKEAQRQAGAGSRAARPMERIRLNADIAQVRVTDSGHVRAVQLDADWGPADKRGTLAATSDDGAPISIRAFPDQGSTALELHVADLGGIAEDLAGYANLRGGLTNGTGRIVPGGYDFEFEIRDMTMLNVPGAAQILAKDGAIRFDRLVAPMRIRGATVHLEDVQATGSSVGLTARGVMDTKTRQMDVVGVVTPAYAINRVFGALFGAREAEGLIGVTYRATGPFTDPKIAINPLSAIAPGFLRRLFEPPTPKPAP